jgi:hypothetical protein
MPGRRTHFSNVTRAHSPSKLLAALLLSVAVAATALSARPVSAAPTRGAPADPQSPPAAVDRLHVLMINGGGSPSENFRSHLMHLEQLSALLLAAGVSPDRITVLASDGAHPNADLAVRQPDAEELWRLRGTEVEPWLSEPITFENSTLSELRLLPATRAQVALWFDRARSHLGPGDTVLLYVTDHGKENPRDPLDNRITLWGRGESLSVRQLRALIERLPEGVRVLTLMSQCFSGGFARIASARGNDDLPTGAACGYFATTADRPAYGCYPEAAAGNRIGHSFAMIDGLAATGQLGRAHAQALVRDQTPDVPLRSSDVYLANLMGRAARAAGGTENAFVDGLLAQMAAARAPAGDAGQRLEEVARAFGLPVPRSLEEIEAGRQELEDLRRSLERHGPLWDKALEEANRVTFRRFLAAHPQWRPRLRPPGLRRLGAEQRRVLVAELLTDMTTFTADDPDLSQEVEHMRNKSAAAQETARRLEGREAALLRMRVLLTTTAARHHLERRGTNEERAAFAALETCEELALPIPGRVTPPKSAPPPLPPLKQDRTLALQVRPAWLGVSFGPVAPQLRVRLRLGEGASMVTQVQPGSPAAQADLRPGDIIVGEEGKPFGRRDQIRAWTMLTAHGETRRLETIRRGERRLVTIVLRPYPD